MELDSAPDTCLQAAQRLNDDAVWESSNWVALLEQKSKSGLATMSSGLSDTQVCCQWLPFAFSAQDAAKMHLHAMWGYPALDDMQLVPQRSYPLKGHWARDNASLGPQGSCLPKQHKALDDTKFGLQSL